MKIIRGIVFGLLICLLLGMAIAGSFYLYQEKHKTPDEIIELEMQKTEAAYKENLKYAMNERRNYDFVVVLNPARGGMDGGCENAFGVEKEITLAVCNEVIAWNTDSKIGIFLTRSGDVGMDEELRLEFINQLDPDLFLDIHLNKNTVQNYGTGVNYKTTYYNRKLSNVQLADLMERSVVTAIEGFAAGITDVTEQEEVSSILNGLTMPAVSIACGDMSHEKEGELLSRTAYQKNLAKGIYDGIVKAKDRLTN